MQLGHQHKIVGIPDCLMPLMAINGNVGNQIVLQSLGISAKEGRYLRDIVRVPMGGQRGGPYRLVNPKILKRALLGPQSLHLWCGRR